MSKAAKLELIRTLEAQILKKNRRYIDTLFPDEGPYRRELYPKQLELFRLGKTYRERAFIAGNRVGKTEAAAYETTCHTTGVYPHWWEGRTWDRPIKCVVAGKTLQTTKDIIQCKLLGTELDDHTYGTGTIPYEHVKDRRYERAPIPKNALRKLFVNHTTGGDSSITFKTYEQGRKLFEGVDFDLVWVDEECPLDVYTEALIRTMTTGGIVMLTFTPLDGITPLIEEFMKEGLLK